MLSTFTHDMGSSIDFKKTLLFLAFILSKIFIKKKNPQTFGKDENILGFCLGFFFLLIISVEN